MLKRPTRNPYSIVLFFAATAILAIGVALRPAKKSAHPLSESDISLQPALQTHRLNQLSTDLIEAAGNAAPRLLFLESAPHTAVLWDHARALTALDPNGARPPAAIRAGDKEIELARVPLPGGTPFEVWTVPRESGLAAYAPAPGPVVSAGNWIIAVARSSRNQLVSTEGVYRGVQISRCGTFEFKQVNTTAALAAELAGGGLFTLNGRLLGIVILCDGEPAVVSVDSIAQVLRRPVFITDTLMQDYGAAFAEVRVDGAAAPQVRVTTVWSGRPAANAGLKAGDIVVQADQEPVRLLADLEALGTQSDPDSAAEHTLTVLRNGKSLTLTLSPGQDRLRQRFSATANGLTLTPDSSGARLLISAIAPYSPWAKSGIEPGDTLLRIAHVPARDPEQALRALTMHRKQPVSIEIERGNNIAEVLLSNE